MGVRDVRKIKQKSSIPEAIDAGTVAAVACPVCKSAAGQWCHTEVGYSRKHVHKERIKRFAQEQPELLARIEQGEAARIVDGARLMRIWTWGYYPFETGDDRKRAVSTEVPVTGPIDLGKGVSVYEAVNPLLGDKYVIEATSGAVLGNSLAEVRQDLSQTSVAAIKKQLAKNREDGQEAKELQNLAFWRRVSNGGQSDDDDDD